MPTTLADLAEMTLADLAAAVDALDPDGQLAAQLRRLTDPTDPNAPKVVAAFSSAL